MLIFVLFWVFCRVFTVQESSIVLGLCLLVIGGRLVLSCIHSRIRFGRFLHGLRVNIYCQLCIALHQPQKKEGNGGNEAKGRIGCAICEIQRPLFLLSWNHTGFEKKIPSLSMLLLRDRGLDVHLKGFIRWFSEQTLDTATVIFVCECAFWCQMTHFWTLPLVLCDSSFEMYIIPTIRMHKCVVVIVSSVYSVLPVDGTRGLLLIQVCFL